MKYISLLVFAAGLSWTWNVIHSRADMPLQTHYIIQEKMQDIVISAIQKQKPSASEIRINSVWTETLKKNKIKTHLNYSFVEASEAGSIKSNISAYAILERAANQGSDSGALDSWTVTEVKATNDSIIFEEGLVVTPGDEPAPPEDLLNPAEGSEN